MSKDSPKLLDSETTDQFLVVTNDIVLDEKENELDEETEERQSLRTRATAIASLPAKHNISRHKSSNTITDTTQPHKIESTNEPNVEDNITLDDIRTSNIRYKILLCSRNVTVLVIVIVYLILFQLIVYFDKNENQTVIMHVKLEYDQIPLPVIYVAFPLINISQVQLSTLSIVRERNNVEQIQLQENITNNNVVVLHLSSIKEYKTYCNKHKCDDEWVVIKTKQKWNSVWVNGQTNNFDLDEYLIIQSKLKYFSGDSEKNNKLNTIILTVHGTEIHANKSENSSTSTQSQNVYISNKGFTYSFYWARITIKKSVGLTSMNDIENDQFDIKKGSAELLPWGSVQYRNFDFSFYKDKLAHKTNYLFMTTSASGYYDQSMVIKQTNIGYDETQYTTSIVMYPNWDDIQLNYVHETKYTWGSVISSVGGFFTTVYGLLGALIIYLGSGYDFEQEWKLCCCANQTMLNLCKRFCCCFIQFHGIAPLATIPRFNYRKQTEMWAIKRELIGRQVAKHYLDKNIHQFNSRLDTFASIFGFQPNDLK
ncbi:hypothetical protein RFI_22262 [Reticulomyxa filosa]|uniref:Uncharacterized protein n=1 Tax=Reticulomyxa filosa TaxID=46433 RepID=X6MM62_RETFI|nr:hypothetical protein RFI_22262 [Reticulomyxa filosa]|eukprot:ETO15108.1 hypothetical protein RFI_22262 [Reticulomyxa filosa]